MKPASQWPAPCDHRPRQAARDRAPVFYQARGAAAPSPAPLYFLVTRQKTVPVIVLGRPMIDKTID